MCDLTHQTGKLRKLVETAQEKREEMEERHMRHEKGYWQDQRKGKHRHADQGRAGERVATESVEATHEEAQD